MNRWNVIAIISLVILIGSLGIYAYYEPDRIAQAEAELLDQYLFDAAPVYIQNCARCHGQAGEGSGSMPVLNNPALASAKAEYLFDTIARAAHGTAMAAWHIREGGVLNDYQITQLVSLIRSGDWDKVVILKEVMDIPDSAVPVPEISDAFVSVSETVDPHECVCCHEEPVVHIGLFGIKCARCHTLDAWKPAMLVRHIFLLDHGGEGNLDCSTCHISTYASNDCFACHDHDPELVNQSHLDEGLKEFENCIECHPTGESGEGKIYMQAFNSLPRTIGEETDAVIGPSPGD